MLVGASCKRLSTLLRDANAGVSRGRVSLQGRGAWGGLVVAALVRAVVAAEKEGEPWRLRTAFGVGLLEGPRPRAHSLVPGAWLRPRQNAP